MLIWAFLLYGIVSGFLLVRLRRPGRRGAALESLGWLTVGLSFAIAALLLASALRAAL